MQWFDVSKTGLAKLLERRGKAYVVNELLSNAWDERATRVAVTLERIPNSPNVRLVVADDNPAGFSDLGHAFTLFAESAKKSDADKRGRFNLGEKLVLAICSEAEIASTTGTIIFDKAGRRKSRTCLPVGSRFTGVLRMSAEEMAECEAAAMRLLPPAHITTTFNGVEIPRRTPVGSFKVALPTEIADAEGVLRRTTRKTTVTAYEPPPGEEACLFELGVPVVVTGDKFHLDVGQKVPLSFERDSVPPGYLARLRAAALEALYARIGTEDANSTWVRDALQRHGDELPAEAINQVMDQRFGVKRVAYDPSDPEANHIAVSKGYQLVYGAQLSAQEWAAARRAESIKPAGQVTPSPKPFKPDGEPLKMLPVERWTPAMIAVADYVRRVGRRVLRRPVVASIANDPLWNYLAVYGDGRLMFNAGRLGHAWFGGPVEKINQLIIHELGHEIESNHLSSAYHEALCRIGAGLVQMALEFPEEMLESTPAAQESA